MEGKKFKIVWLVPLVIMVALALLVNGILSTHGGQQPVSSIAQFEQEIVEMDFSPDGNQIAVVTCCSIEGYHQLWVANTRLTRGLRKLDWQFVSKMSYPTFTWGEGILYSNDQSSHSFSWTLDGGKQELGAYGTPGCLVFCKDMIMVVFNVNDQFLGYATGPDGSMPTLITDEQSWVFPGDFYLDRYGTAMFVDVTFSPDESPYGSLKIVSLFTNTPIVLGEGYLDKTFFDPRPDWLTEQRLVAIDNTFSTEGDWIAHANILTYEGKLVWDGGSNSHSPQWVGKSGDFVFVRGGSVYYVDSEQTRVILNLTNVPSINTGLVSVAINPISGKTYLATGNRIFDFAELLARLQLNE